jgi:hypothetical protein
VTSFSDDFNRPDGSPGANWVQVSGTWSIISNQLSPGTTSGTVLLRAATAMASNDNYAQVKITATTPVSQGVWCRGNSDLTSGYALRNNGSNWALFSVVGGTFTSIGTYSAAAVADDVAKVQAVGSTIKAVINGVERINVVNTAVTTGTSVGIRSEANTGLRYDDFTAADVVAGATLGIASSTETAQPLTSSKTADIGTATEASSAQAVAGAKTAALTPASEQDAAQPLTGTKTAALTPAVEQDTAETLAGVVTATLGVAGADETAQPLVGAKTATLTPASEVDTARPLTEASTNVPSPERTYMIPAENRRLTVAAEHRTLTVRR